MRDSGHGFDPIPQSFALVSGGNRGIGYELCRLLGLRGYIVFLGSRDKQNGDAAVERLARGDPALAGRIRVLAPFDVADISSIQARAAETATLLSAASPTSRIGILINNAGVSHKSDWGDAVVEEVFAVNLRGAVAVADCFAPFLSSESVVVNVGSAVGRSALNGMGARLREQFNTALSAAQLEAVLLTYVSHVKEGQTDDANFTGGTAPPPSPYAISKAGLLVWTWLQSEACRGKRATAQPRVICADPGWCRTRMTKGTGVMTAADGAQRLLASLEASAVSPGGFYFEADLEIAVPVAITVPSAAAGSSRGLRQLMDERLKVGTGGDDGAWRDWQISKRLIREHFLAPSGTTRPVTPSPTPRRTVAELAAEFVLAGAVKIPKFFTDADTRAIIDQLTSMDVDAREVLYHGKRAGSHITMRAYVSPLPASEKPAEALGLLTMMSDTRHDVVLPARLGWWVTAQPFGGAVGPESENGSDSLSPLEWHIDGPAETKDAMTSKRIVLLLPLMVRTTEHNGPTVMKPGSHRIAAEILRECGPMEQPELVRRVLEDERFRRLPSAYATGEAGDLWLLHPFTMHSTTVNRSPVPRPQSNQFIWTPKGCCPLDISPAQHSLVAAACHMWLDDTGMTMLLAGSGGPQPRRNSPAFVAMPFHVQSMVQDADFITSQVILSNRDLKNMQSIQYRLGNLPVPLKIVSNYDCFLHAEAYSRSKLGRYGWATVFHELCHLTKRGVIVVGNTDSALKQWMMSLAAQLETRLVPGDRLFIYDSGGVIRPLSNADREVGRILAAADSRETLPSTCTEDEEPDQELPVSKL